MTEDDLEKEEQPRYFSKIDQMYQHFNEQFEQNDFSAALTHILTESEQGSFKTALAACIEQEAFIRTSKVIDSHKLEYGLAYFAHIVQDYRSVFEINLIITYIALRIDQKTSTSTHKERIHYHCYLLLKRITQAEVREKNENTRELFRWLLDCFKTYLVLKTETKVQDYLNQKKNEFYQLYWTISLETNPKNRNHIWRYIEFFINSIDQIKSKKGIKTKEEKSKGIKRLRRIGSLPNEPVQVKLLEVERRDEDDENDEQAVSIHINLDADTVTSRTRGIGQSAEQIAQIIYRRHYPTVFNPVYLEPELLEIVYNVLIDKFTYQPGSDESQVAAVFLLSLFTGSPVSAFLNIKDLFETEVLSRAIDIHGYLFRYSTSLETTKLEGNIGEYQKILGTSHHWNILLPASWVDSASALKGMVSSELNSYLKLWFSEYCIGRLSVETLAQQIHFQIARLDPKSLIKEFIKNQKIYHEPTLAYAVFNTTSINRCYANFLKLMMHHSTSTEYIEGHTSEIDHPLIWPNNAKKVGSQKVWSKHQAKLFIAALKQDLEKKLSSPKIDVQVQVNTYATWIWTISMLTLGIRPNTGAPGLMMHYDEQLQLIYVHDKKSGSRPYGRYIPVTKFLKQEIQQYREFLKKVNPKAYRRAQKKHDLICYIDKGKQLTGVTAEFIDAQLKAKGFKLYKNWARHFLIAEANLPIDIQKSLYAHDSTDLGFAEYSSISFAVYKKKIIAAVEKLLQALELIT